jgi:hypothetical protein
MLDRANVSGAPPDASSLSLYSKVGPCGAGSRVAVLLPRSMVGLRIAVRTACSAVSPATIRSQACCRQCTLKGSESANQFGKTVKVFPHGRQIPRRTQIRSCWSSWAWRSRRPWPMIVSSWQSGHSRGRRCNGTTPAQCCLWCPAVRKKNHGWREGPPLTVACDVSICWPGLHPPGKVRFKRKKNTAFCYRRELPTQNIGRL